MWEWPGISPELTRMPQAAFHGRPSRSLPLHSSTPHAFTVRCRWQRRVLPPQADRAAQIGIYTQHYHDTLLRGERRQGCWG